MPIAWNSENAAHLLRRAGFGASRARIDAAVEAGLEATVDSLFVADPTPDTIPWSKPSTLQLQGWWLARMVTTTAPLHERVVLFFHEHFATAVSKVKKKPLVFAQNRLLRQKALGKFRNLLRSMVRDPALLLFLDNQSNVVASPNENFARELMELFSLGVNGANGGPNYTEFDVSECSRAFTGYTVKNGEFTFDASQHDSGTKTFRGVTGKLDGDQIATMLAEDPATARRLAQKLWSHFAHPAGLKHPVVAELAGVYLAADTDIETMLRQMFTHEAFYSAAAKAGVIRSPTEFVVVALRGLSAKPSSSPAQWTKLGQRVASMGQALFDPPSVFGWPGGTTWVELSGMQRRVEVASWLAEQRSSGSSSPVSFDPSALLGLEDEWPHLDAQGVVDRVLDALGPLVVKPSTRVALLDYVTSVKPQIEVDVHFIDRKVRGLIALAMASPEYQLALGSES
jgi:uncharacterized protein (DUF1800 family)